MGDLAVLAYAAHGAFLTCAALLASAGWVAAATTKALIPTSRTMRVVTLRTRATF